MESSTPTTEEWHRRKIITPTFKLKPAEKPDMSPFLVHLTGKNSLIDILKGTGAEMPTQGWGFLKSGIPSYTTAHYHSPVVCFTESPIFALDFFRLRSYSRFMAGQQYGIGFSKSSLVRSRGVRPVIYLDRKTNTDLLKVISLAEESSLNLTDNLRINDELSASIRNLKPLLFPLFENADSQGFMWEREWRFPEPQGFVFSYAEIEIICCPREERAQIEELLGTHISRVEIIENWKEYDEVKSYLESRGVDVLQNVNLSSIHDINNLLKLQEDTQQMMNGLNLFRNTFELTSSTYNDAYIKDKLEKLYQFHWTIERQIEMISAFEKERFEEVRSQYHQQQMQDYY